MHAELQASKPEV